MKITNALGQEIISEADWEKLVQNHTVSKCVINNDPTPVVKLFTPDASATWILTEIDSEAGTAFGLCDLGVGCSELGYVSLQELTKVRGVMGLPIEKDLHIDFQHPLSYYTNLFQTRDSSY